VRGALLAEEGAGVEVCVFSLKAILVPVDFSERSVGAARYAEALVEHFGARPLLLHVLPPPHYELSSMEVCGSVINELFATRTRQVREELDSFLRREIPKLEAERVLAEGDPAQKIVEYAHDRRVDLIVVSTHGYGPFRRFILGSVTAKILHDADCPVWTGVHLEQAPDVGRITFRTVMAAVDLGPQSRKTVDWAAALAASYQARLIVVNAMPCIEARAGDYPERDWKQRLTSECRAKTEELLRGASCEAEVWAECGDAPEVVCHAARRAGADLLVIGRGSAAGVFGRLRANAYSIIRMSPCPVVSV
jgi:nucleotide-binding universal stress UspA family protein